MPCCYWSNFNVEFFIGSFYWGFICLVHDAFRNLNNDSHNSNFQLILTHSTEEALDSALAGVPLTTNSNSRLTQSRPRVDVAEDRGSKRRHESPRSDADADSDVKKKRVDDGGTVPKRKTLEELFRRTKTQPCIYWLPKVEWFFTF